MADIERIGTDINPSSSTTPSAPRSEGTVRLRVNEVMYNTPPLEVNPKTGEVKERREYGELGPELVKSTARTLEGFAIDLLRLKNFKDPNHADRTLFDLVMTDPNWSLEKNAIKLLTDELIDKNTGKVLDMQVSPAKIQQLLNDGNSRGWAIAMQLIEQQRILKEEVMGLAIESHSPEDQLKIKQRLKIGSTPISNRLRHLLNRLGEKDENGTPVKTHTNKDLYDAFVRGSPEQSAVFLAMTGIDPREWDLDHGRAKLKLNTGGAALAGTSGNIEQLHMSVLSSLEVQRQFYKAMGVPEDLVLSSTEQGIYSYTKLPSQAGMEWENKVMARYKEKIATVGAPSSAMSLGILMQARRDVVAEDIQRELERSRTGESTEKAITTLNKKIEARQDQGAVRAAKEKEFTAEQGSLETDKAPLQEGQAKLDAYQTALSELDALRMQAIAEGLDPNADDEDKIQAVINKKIDWLTNLADKTSYIARKQDLQDRRKRDVNNAINTLNPASLAALKDKAQQDMVKWMKEQTAESFSSEEEGLEAEKAEYVRQIARLREIHTAIIDKKRTLRDFDPTVRGATQVVEDRQRDFTVLTSWNGTPIPGGAGVYELNLTTLKTMTVKELLQRINDINAADPTHTKGWPKEQNDIPGNRQALERAIAQARTGIVSNNDFTKYVAWGLSANQLRIASPDEINRHMNLRFARTSHLALRFREGWDAADNAAHAVDLRTVTQYARGLLSQEIAGGAAQLENIEQQRNDLEGRKKTIDVTKELTRLEVTRDLLQRQSEVLGNAENLIQTLKAVDAAKFIIPVPATDSTFTPEEIAAGYDRGYYVLMNYLFDYQQSSDRAAQFKKIQTALPPDELAIILNDSFDLGLGGAPSIKGTLDEVRKRVKNGTVFEYNIATKLADIVQQVKARGLAIS